ncbi:hypothetical protein [Streptomyces cyaneus]|uniref:hypothetical protein n=1 Tax=Streptomyces cyaneus TaxID=1904 RepID=UPI0013E3D6D0|nr:hypothetical protein [Streptomyces cyaneus]
MIALLALTAPPVAAVVWLPHVVDDAIKDPGEDPCGAQFVFWVCFVTSLLLL